MNASESVVSELDIVAFADFMSYGTGTDVTCTEMQFIGAEGSMGSFHKKDIIFDMYFNRAHGHIFRTHRITPII